MTELFDWDQMSSETMGPGIKRKFLTGDQSTIARFYLAKGAIVSKHSHKNEQFTYILEGALCFWLGDDESEKIVVRKGQVLRIPSGVPHKIEALEDSIDLDVFSPVREDWLSGDDDYFR